MIDPEHDLPIQKQAEVLDISRSTVYYQPRPVSEADLWLMRQIDELHLNYPFAGSRMLRDLLGHQGLEVGRRHIRTLMRKMAIEAIYRRPNTSKPAPGHRIYPYLLRGLAITRPNQVWAMDITYIPMARGFVYLAAVVDWFSRRVLAWKLSITMETNFCIEALEEALSRNEKPEIFNTDQGSQFTSEAFTGRLKKEGIRISMDGKGRWRDNVFVNVFYNPGGEGAHFDYGYRGAPSYIELGFDASKASHRFAIEWNPCEIRWLVDDHLVHRRAIWDPTPIPHLPMALHVNIWPSRSTQLAGQINNRRLPATTIVGSIALEATFRYFLARPDDLRRSS